MSSTVSSQPLLGPIIGLTAWTFVQEAWMYALRIPALSKYKIDTSPTKAKDDIRRLPAHIQFPADNYAHLHEQPTYFLAVALVLNALEVRDSNSVRLAWAYVGLRVVHSLVQSSYNLIFPRFIIFVTSSAVLIALTARAGLTFFGSSSR